MSARKASIRVAPAESTGQSLITAYRFRSVLLASSPFPES